MAIINQFPSGNGISIPSGYFPGIYRSATASGGTKLIFQDAKLMSTNTPSSSAANRRACFIPLQDFTATYIKTSVSDTGSYTFKAGKEYQIAHYSASSTSYWFVIYEDSNAIINHNKNSDLWANYLLNLS